MRGLNSALTALNGLPLPVHVYVRGVEPAEVAAQAAPQVSVHLKLPDFGVILPQTRLFIHHAGAVRLMPACWPGCRS